jgi:hypothetical protein
MKRKGFRFAKKGHQHRVGSDSIYFKEPPPKPEKPPKSRRSFFPPEYSDRLFLIFLTAAAAQSWYFVPYIMSIWCSWINRDFVDTLFVFSSVVTLGLVAISALSLLDRSSRITFDRTVTALTIVSPVMWFVRLARLNA